MVLVICTLKPALIDEYASQIKYLPLTNEKTDEHWRELITQYQPTTVLFGLQTLDETKFKIWRELMPNIALRCVRKGTSLHRVDLAAAEKYRITILNTAGVNAPFVAKFVIDKLTKQPGSIVGIVGVGDIGRGVAATMISSDANVLLYNRTHHELKGQYCYVDSLDTLFSQCQEIAVCIALTDATKEIITARHINACLPHAKIICIAPPRVFAAEAICALDERDDLTVIFDHVVSGRQYIYDSLQRTTFKAHFTFEEKAASGYECQYAMGKAALLKAIVAING